MPDRPTLRKQQLGGDPAAAAPSPGEIDLAAETVVSYTSEDPDHPVEHLLDRRTGPTGSRWLAATDGPQTLVFAFDQPRPIARLRYEVAESAAERTQEVRIEASTDGGATFQTILSQDYNFSPGGATFQSEEITRHLTGVTHLRLTIVPNKQGPGRATLTSFRAFER